MMDRNLGFMKKTPDSNPLSVCERERETQSERECVRESGMTSTEPASRMRWKVTGAEMECVCLRERERGCACVREKASVCVCEGA